MKTYARRRGMADYDDANALYAEKQREHLVALEQARQEAFDSGQWDRVDMLQNCIDDTNKIIKQYS